MQLPIDLQEAIEELAKKVPLPALRLAYKQLSEAYRRGENSGLSFKQPEVILAYLLARMPATYAAVYKVLQDVRERLPHWSCQAIVDLGAGPGTASWAAAEVFPEAKNIKLFEKSKEIISFGKQLTSFATRSVLNKSEWIERDIIKNFLISDGDLIILSYVLSEIKNLDLIEKISEKNAIIVILEPGTPKGFEKIISCRELLIRKGRHLVAPCPHQLKCPINGWCHFPARVERSKFHKFMKEGSLGYEDEKFSYLVSSPFTPLPFAARVIAPPLKLSGHVKLSVCSSEGQIVQKTVTKKDRELYRQARDAEWFSSFSNI